MIDEIHVENLALIRSATLTPCAGLTVLTGETGAGKTALLSACKLLIGERASAQMVRDGEDSLVVSGRFFVKDVAAETEATLSTGETERDIVVTRRVSADGRSRVTLNGAMASATQLTQMLSPVVDLCGQHEHQRLLKPTNHVAFLDAWAKDRVEAAKAQYKAAFLAAKEAQAAFDRVQSAASASSTQLDEARFVLRTINEVNPVLGEYEQLTDSLAKAEHAEALIRGAEGAHQALSSEEGGALDALNSAIYMLDQAGRFDESLLAYAKSLREAVYLAEDVAADVRTYCDSIDFDESELARMQERTSALQRLLRSYGPGMEDVLAARDQAETIVNAMDDSKQRLQAAQDAVNQAELVLVKAADALDEARQAVAPRFEQAVYEQMKRLCMGSARLVCSFERQARNVWTKSGPSSVEFLFCPGAEMSPRPLARIASGGEVSRVMLALRVVLGQSDTAETLIFDEVDAGVGGATAVALAQVLVDLAKTRQVLVVTHLPQVAVHAQCHYVVKKADSTVPETTITPVQGVDRVNEIARMLAGEESQAACAHAAELLAQAQE